MAWSGHCVAVATLLAVSEPALEISSWAAVAPFWLYSVLDQSLGGLGGECPFNNILLYSRIPISERKMHIHNQELLFHYLQQWFSVRVPQHLGVPWDTPQGCCDGGAATTTMVAPPWQVHVLPALLFSDNSNSGKRANLFYSCSWSAYLPPHALPRNRGIKDNATCPKHTLFLGECCAELDQEWQQYKLALLPAWS